MYTLVLLIKMPGPLLFPFQYIFIFQWNVSEHSSSVSYKLDFHNGTKEVFSLTQCEL